MILRERLQLSSPMQRLYERVYFDRYDLAHALVPFDNFHDETVHMKAFVQVIVRDVASLGEQEAMQLCHDAPHVISMEKYG